MGHKRGYLILPEVPQTEVPQVDSAAHEDRPRPSPGRKCWTWRRPAYWPRGITHCPY